MTPVATLFMVQRIKWSKDVKTRQAIIQHFGGPEVIHWQDVDLPAPGPGQVLVRHTAVGLNYIDTYHRSGLYPMDLPSGLGIEAAGVVEALGADVHGFSMGQRVATFGPARGAYATARIMDASLLLAIPDDISDETAAAAMLKGCTAEFLVERCACVQPGMTVLVHAAAGGVGLILVQWLKAIGATVIGTVSTEEKAQAARAAGADHVVLYTQDDTAAAVRALTDGAGVQVVFDGVGMATWESSLDSCGKRGMIVSYGNASGPVSGVNLGLLATKGSLFCTRPTLFDYYITAEERAAGAERLWAMIRSGAVSITVGQHYALEKAAQAHADLEARKTSGSTLLVV